MIEVSDQSNDLLVVFIFLVVFVSVLLITKLFFKIKIEKFDSYSSTPTLVKKMRLLATLTLFVVPLIAFYESEGLKLYQTNWPLVFLTVFLSFLVLVISFTIKLTSKRINIILGTYYLLIISIVYLIAFQLDLYITILTEAAVLLIFSKIIFQKLKYIIYAFVYIYVYLVILTLIFTSYESHNFGFFVSTLIMFSMATAAIIIVESSSISNLSFSNKVLNYSDLLVLVSDIEGNIVYVSKPLKDFTKYSEEELLNTGWWDITRKEGYSISDIKNDLLDTLEKGNKSKYLTKIHLRDGVFDLEWEDFSLENKFVMSVGKDVTEELIIRNSNQKLSYVAKNTENGVLILNANLGIEWVNEAFTDIFGYSLNEVSGKDPASFLNGPKTNSETLAQMDEKLKLNEHIEVEILAYDKAGNEKWILISMDPIYNEDREVINYVAIDTDITERKLQIAIIEEQNTSIIDSMNYSAVIQNAILPSPEGLEEIKDSTFIYYEPKEIIGGDFYLIDTIVNDDGDDVEIYVVADCTGHGVPGAMLSVLCTTIIKEAIRFRDIKNPAKALDLIRSRLVEIFTSSKDHTINDGMDLSFCAVNKKKSFIEYAGANRPLIIIRDGEINLIRGDKQSVGFGHKMKKFTFSQIPYKSGDTLYMYSDGVVDQFGGVKDKKFMTKRLNELLLEVNGFEMHVQCEEIKARLKNWKGDNEQTDDICLMGIRL